MPRTHLLQNVLLLVFVAVFAAACSAPPKAPLAHPGEPAPEQAKASVEGEPEGDGYDARLTGYDYPYEVRIRSFEGQRQSLQMAYMDVHADAPNGRTVLLLHGKNFSGAYWERTIEALVAEGYRVVVPDQIGFGKSTKPEHLQFTFQALALWTRDLLDELGVDDVTVVGHSMGGMLATRFVLMFPERSAGLVLVNPIGLEDWRRDVPYQPVEAWYERTLASTPESIRRYMEQSYFDGQWKPEYEPLVEIQAGWATGPDRERLAWVSALTYDMIFTQPVVYDFPRVQTPTLLIIGERDRTALGKGLVAPEVAARLGDYSTLGEKAAAAIPGAQLVELPGVGHLPQFEVFDAYVGALLEFLGGR